MATKPTTREQELERLDRSLARLFRLIRTRDAGATGISPSQRAVLRALEESPLQISEVAATLGVTLSAATGLVDRMARNQLVERERDQADRRVVWVRLTEAGRQAARAAEEERRRVLQEVFAPLSDEELQTLANLLERARTDL
ncbi:MAG: MarR family transcriptional regulator [Firmicutes bacterium]|nr:MarR family transcriptional regulator [Bacillota bacterium]